MRARPATLILACSIALAVAPPVSAGEQVPPCARLPDRTERLDCYDALFGKPVEEARPAAAAPAPASASAPAAESFGLTQQQIDRNVSGAGARNPDSLTSAVTALTRGRNGQFTVTLANGQVWTQSEIDSRAKISIGDPVTIRRAALGSYLLATPGGIATRVKRLN